MPQLYLRFHLLWTCMLLFTLSASANNYDLLPPILTNPSACNLGLPIKDFSCDASHFFQINVSNAPGTSLGEDVYLKEVRLIIAHEWNADLDITLISPNDVAIDLSSDNGSGQDHYGNPSNCNEPIVFISGNSENACQATSIVGQFPPFIGDYLPEQDFLPLYDGTDPNDFWVLQVCDDGKDHTGTLEYVELVFEPVVCLNPTNVEIISVDSTSVLVNWAPGNSCDSNYLEFGNPGFSPGTTQIAGSGNSTVVLDSCPPGLIQGLSPSTSYELYIRTECSSDNFSINSCPVTFSTTCSPPSMTLKEDFNSQINCSATCGVACQIQGMWQNSLIDDFDWIVSDKNNITTVGTGPDDDNPGGGKYIYIESNGSSCTNGRESSLISNCMLVKAGSDSCDMSFDYLMFGANVHSLRLEFKETGNTNWEIIHVLSGNRGNLWATQFIDLDEHNGKNGQFRFVAVGGNGILGDIALDNIIFYGSEDLGPPPFVYYRDKDMDGYGGQDVYFATCSFEPNTPGFVPNKLDCNDDEFFINPGMPEYPCDTIDLNCNGHIDEFRFEPPITSDTTICSGAVLPFVAQPRFFGNIFWSSDELGSDTLHIGNEFWLQNFPANFSDTPISLTYYAKEIKNDTCFSSMASSVTITILPQADINTTDSPTICEGASFDLSTIDVIDNNGANGVISYHSAEPINPGNEISPIVVPAEGQTYYIASTPNGGCTDIASVDFNILDSPNAEIIGERNVCKNTFQTLTANDIGSGQAPLIYSWNTGETSPTIDISSHPSIDSSNTYILEISGSNGCTDTDTMDVTTISNISQIRRIIDSVTVCGGSDGVIRLTPLDGLAPFTFRWGNNMSFIGDSLILDSLSQGSWSFTITDSSPEQCDFVIPLMTVNGPGAVVASSQVNHVSCNGFSDGEIILNVNGSNPVINWSNGSTGESVSGLAKGTHSVTITDGTCQNIIDFEITEPEKLSVNPTITQPECNGGQDGSIFLNVFGGSSIYQFNWQNGLETQGLNNLSAGNYPVTVTDSRGCEQTFPSLIIQEPDQISYDTIGLFQPSCFGSQDGKISIKPSGGTSPYDVDWNTAAMGTTINSLMSDNYEVTIEDANGCEFIDTIFLDQPRPVFLVVDQKQNPICKGQSNGLIDISIGGGTPGFEYLWNNGNQTQDLINVPEGDYIVTVTDSNDCTFISVPIPIIGPEVINVSAETIQPPCIGRNIGEITVAVSDSTATYSFDWNIDESGPTILDQAPGTYTVTVTNDSTKCQIDTTFVLTTEQKLNLNIDFEHPSCHEQSTGEIFLIASGGTQPFQYNWGDTVLNSALRTNLAAGNYLATVTDAEGCVISSNDIYLSYPAPLQLEVVKFDTPICFGDSTGIIEVNGHGGTGLLKYKWSSGDTSDQISNLGEGIYHVSITDVNNCSISENFEINWPNKLIVEEVRYISGCESLDSVCIDISGGQAPYQIDWSHGDSVHCLVDVPVGDYVVTVTDEIGCSEELMSIKVPDQVSPIYIQQLPSKDSLCHGESNGEIVVHVEGGSLPYQYLWQNGTGGTSNDTVLQISNLNPGLYRVTITDDDGCISVSPYYSIVQGQELESFIQDIKDAGCTGDSTGILVANAHGGFEPYQFIWKNIAGDTLSLIDSLNNLPQGIYQAQITDNQGCMDFITAAISEPDFELGIDSQQVRRVSCFDDGDGVIIIYPVGGTKDYSFTWSNGTNSQNLENVGAGIYSVTITDQNNCIYVDEFEVVGPESPLGIEFYNIEIPPCYGESGGSIDVDIIGGTAPYYYDWGMSNNEDLINIEAGEYHLMVFDSTLECTFDTTFIVNQPDSIIVDTLITPATSGNEDGAAALSPMGGTPPYQYYWSDLDVTTSTISNVPSGWYDYTVTDANGCTQIGAVYIPEIVSVIDRENVAEYSLFPNPTSSLINLNLQLNKTLNIELQLFNSLGQIIFTENKNQINNANWLIDLQNYSSGIYYLKVKNKNGILITDRIVKY